MNKFIYKEIKNVVSNAWETDGFNFAIAAENLTELGYTPECLIHIYNSEFKKALKKSHPSKPSKSDKMAVKGFIAYIVKAMFELQSTSETMELRSNIVRLESMRQTTLDAVVLGLLSGRQDRYTVEWFKWLRKQLDYQFGFNVPNFEDRKESLQDVFMRLGECIEGDYREHEESPFINILHSEALSIEDTRKKLREVYAVFK